MKMQLTLFQGILNRITFSQLSRCFLHHCVQRSSKLLIFWTIQQSPMMETPCTKWHIRCEQNKFVSRDLSYMFCYLIMLIYFISGNLELFGRR